MLISGVISDSFQEFDGLQSTVFFTVGCNLACPWCHNNGLMEKSIGDFKDIYKSYINDMTQAVVFLGGEPTIWEDLKTNILLVKDNFPDLKIKLFTNSQMPERTIECLPYLDSISMDYKMDRYDNNVIGRDVPLYHDNIHRVLSVANDILKTGKLSVVEIRTTLNPYITTEDVESIGNMIHTLYPNFTFIKQNMSK